MRTVLSLVVAAAGTWMGPMAQARSFTPVEGTPIDGTVVRADDRQVIIRETGTGREVSLPLADVSQADRRHVMEWREEHPVLNFRIDAAKIRVRHDTYRSKDERSTSDDYQYEITIENRSQDSIAGLIAQCAGFIWVDDKASTNSGISAVVKCTVAVPRIGPMSRTTVVTRSLKAKSKDFRQVTTDTIRTERWSESIRGLNLQLFWRNRPVMTWNTGGCDSYGLQMTAEEQDKARAEVLGWTPVLPGSLTQTAEWRYTLTDPGKGFERPNFADGGWDVAPAPFGSPTESEALPRTLRTEWPGERLWMRRRFTLPAGTKVEALHLQSWIDDAADVWIDGLPVASLGARSNGGRTPLPKELRDVLAQPGPHFIAVAARNFTGPRAADFAIVEKQSAD